MNESCIQDLISYCTGNTCQQYKADTMAVNFEDPRELVKVPCINITECLGVKHGGVYIITVP
jgi:hypothetical protein